MGSTACANYATRPATMSVCPIRHLERQPPLLALQHLVVLVFVHDGVEVPSRGLQVRKLRSQRLLARLHAAAE